MFDRKSTIESFLENAAAKQATPGGGSVTALAGALAASMGEMVVNYSVGKKGLEAHQGELSAALSEFNRARMTLLQMMEEDQQAYARVAQLYKEKDQKQGEYQEAIRASIRVPEAMSMAAVKVLGLCEKVVGFANVRLLSDLAVCADLAMATLRCAIYNVRVNLKEVSDAGARAPVETLMRELMMRGVETIQRVSPRIWERVEKES